MKVVIEESERDIETIFGEELVVFDTINITDAEWDALFILYKNKAINERRTFSEFIKELIQLKRG